MVARSLTRPAVRAARAKPLRRRIREVTREALLAAAEGTIASRGLHDTRIEDVATAAGVAVGTIYNYFQDRQTLVQALLEVRRQEVVSRIGDALDRSAGRSFRERLESFVSTAFRQFEAHRPLFALFIDQEIASVRPGSRSEPGFREIVDQAGVLVQSGIAQGELDPDGAELYPLLLLGMMRGLISLSLYRKAVPLDQLVPVVVRMFCDGAKRRT